jgi:hypothetical protein
VNRSIPENDEAEAGFQGGEEASFDSFAGLCCTRILRLNPQQAAERAAKCHRAGTGPTGMAGPSPIVQVTLLAR